jgi:hypothetical protein
MKDSFTTYLVPVDKDGKPDRRFDVSIIRILDELNDGTIEELRQFSRETAQIQRRAASAGLRLAIAVFHEAAYLDKNHRFDVDNKFGWRSKALRKQAQQILEQIGFKQKNAHKLVMGAAWLTNRPLSKEEEQWLESLTPSHIYELSRMSDEGLAHVKKRVTYPGYMFTAGQQEISVRAMEEIRSQFPRKTVQQADNPADSLKDTSSQSVTTHSVEECQIVDGHSTLLPIDLAQLQSANDSTDPTNAELLHQFTDLVRTIDWASISTDLSSRKLLSSMADALTLISELAILPSCSETSR